MPEQFGVIPVELRAVSRRLADVGDRIREVQAQRQEMVAAEVSAPWGDDKIGTQFAAGDNAGDGYVDRRADQDESCDALADRCEVYAQLLKDVADSFEYYDQV
jgi:hypothetical protein